MSNFSTMDTPAYYDKRNRNGRALKDFFTESALFGLTAFFVWLTIYSFFNS